jgi:hypothetical protein
MPICRLSLIILFTVLSVFPQSVIKITGKVITTDSVPIPGVTVELKQRGVKDTTDSAGSFFLIDTVRQISVLKEKRPSIPTSYSFSKNCFLLTLTEQNSIHLELFDVSGKKLGTVVDGTFKPGAYKIPLSINNGSTQVHLLRFKIGSMVECVKLCTEGKDLFAQRKVVALSGSGLAKKASSPIDTIIITHNGFLSQRLPIIDSISSMIIILTKKPSTPQVWAVGDLGRLKDTIISQRDSLLVGIGAKDSTGIITKYYWDIGGNGWIDSTSKSDSALKYIKYPSGGYIPIIVGAKNDAGFLGTDTFHILFNRPPTSCGLKTDYNTDKGGWSDFNYSTSKGDIQVSFTGEDPDGVHDNLKYDLYWGTDQNNLSKQYSGVNTTVSISDIPIQTQFYWKVVARDLFGDSIQGNGSYRSNGTPQNGIFWNLITDNPNTTLNYGAGIAACTYDNKMWVIASITYNGDKTRVYNSTDGISWNLISDNPNIALNYAAAIAACTYDNKMWAIASIRYNGDKTRIYSTGK